MALNITKILRTKFRHIAHWQSIYSQLIPTIYKQKSHNFQSHNLKFHFQGRNLKKLPPYKIKGGPDKNSKVGRTFLQRKDTTKTVCRNLKG